MHKYAVIGHPVAHSLSPDIHHAFARQTQRNIEYSKIEAPLDGFAETVLKFRDAGGKGCNVTLPFKPEAFALADERTPATQLAKAANLLVFKAGGMIGADNVDGVGLVQDLTTNHNFDLHQKNILIIGAGGACRTILAALLQKAPKHITIANRTVATATQLVNQLSQFNIVSACGLDQLPSLDHAYDLIVHATSLGTQGQAPNLPDGLIHAHTWCYDLSYGENAKPFLNLCQPHQPAMLLDGLGMLVEQAAASFYLWEGVYPETRALIKQLQQRL